MLYLLLGKQENQMLCKTRDSASFERMHRKHAAEHIDANTRTSLYLGQSWDNISHELRYPFRLVTDHTHGVHCSSFLHKSAP